jgi:hypothetical protein
VIDTAKAGPPYDDRWKLQPRDHIPDIRPRRDRDVNPTDSFDDHIFIPAGEKAIDLPDDTRIDNSLLGASCSKWSYGQFKLVWTDSPERFLTFENGPEAGGIGVSHSGWRDSRLDRLHHADSETKPLQRQGQGRRD